MKHIIKYRSSDDKFIQILKSELNCVQSYRYQVPSIIKLINLKLRKGSICASNFKIRIKLKHTQLLCTIDKVEASSYKKIVQKSWDA